MNGPPLKEIVLPLSQQSPPKTAFAVLPGATVIGRIRRVLIVALVAGLMFPLFTHGSKGRCPGGVSSDGGFVDATGQPTTEAPRCVTLELGPNPLVFVGIALIVLLALGRIMRAADEPAALRTLDRAAILVVVLVLVAAVISQVWFRLVSLETFDSDSWSVFSPFPFAIIDVEITRMTAP
jgi:hypothetical protein